MLCVAVAANIVTNLYFPVLSAACRCRLSLGGASCDAPWRRPDWSVLPEAFKGTVFLLALVLRLADAGGDAAAPSWHTALGLGFVSAVFDNIPLTKLALEQGGYDWGFLAYAVGFGGSMIWFGSSAGVAVSNLFPEAKSVGQWLRHGWHVAVGYVIGFSSCSCWSAGTLMRRIE